MELMAFILIGWETICEKYTVQRHRETRSLGAEFEIPRGVG